MTEAATGACVAMGTPSSRAHNGLFVEPLGICIPCVTDNTDRVFVILRPVLMATIGVILVATSRSMPSLDVDTDEKDRFAEYTNGVTLCRFS